MHACVGEGNGNPLHCSCLENPRDGGAWWAAVYGSHRVGHDWSDLAAEWYGCGAVIFNFTYWEIFWLSTFWLLQIKLLWTIMYKYLCGHRFSFLWDKNLGAQLLGYKVNICLAFKINSKCFLAWLYHLTCISPAMYEMRFIWILSTI